MLVEKFNACQCELSQIDSRLKDVPKTQTNMDELKRTIRIKLQNARELLTSDLNKDDLRCVLKKWIDGIRLDGDGKVFIRWNANAIYELLDIHAANVQVDFSGNPPTPTWIQAANLSKWHPLEVSAIKPVVRLPMQASAVFLEDPRNRRFLQIQPASVSAVYKTFQIQQFLGRT